MIISRALVVDLMATQFRNVGVEIRRYKQGRDLCAQVLDFFLPYASLLNLNHAFPRIGLDLIHPRDNFTGEIIQRPGVRRVFAFEYRRFATVAGFAKFRVELDVPEEGYV